jgi:hypothetical protein
MQHRAARGNGAAKSSRSDELAESILFSLGAVCCPVRKNRNLQSRCNRGTQRLSRREKPGFKSCPGTAGTTLKYETRTRVSIVLGCGKLWKTGGREAWGKSKTCCERSSAKVRASRGRFYVPGRGLQERGNAKAGARGPAAAGSFFRRPEGLNHPSGTGDIEAADPALACRANYNRRSAAAAEKTELRQENAEAGSTAPADRPITAGRPRAQIEIMLASLLRGGTLHPDFSAAMQGGA